MLSFKESVYDFSFYMNFLIFWDNHIYQENAEFYCPQLLFTIMQYNYIVDFWIDLLDLANNF